MDYQDRHIFKNYDEIKAQNLLASLAPPPKADGFKLSNEPKEKVEEMELENSAENLRDTRVNADEKLYLAIDYQESKGGLDINFLLIALGIMIVVLAFALPWIYLGSNIYYASKNITTLVNQKSQLEAQNAALKRLLQNLQFKYNIKNKE